MKPNHGRGHCEEQEAMMWWELVFSRGSDAYQGCVLWKQGGGGGGGEN